VKVVAKKPVSAKPTTKVAAVAKTKSAPKKVAVKVAVKVVKPAKAAVKAAKPAKVAKPAAAKKTSS